MKPACMRLPGWLWPALVLACLAPPVQAWSGHTLCTWQALQDMPEIAGKVTKAESLEHFIEQQAPRLERALAEHEAWAIAHLEHYPPRPPALAFRAAPVGDDVRRTPRERFLRALRLNPLSRLGLFLQARPGQTQSPYPRLPWVDITALKSGAGSRGNDYLSISENTSVSVLDVVAAASNEPDYGLDVGLLEDNGTPFGQQYGFGRQAFGNDTVDYSSQAQFHMGFHHESPVVFAAAGFLRRTFPEVRITQFLTMAREAFASGHDYWGWRFTGWAIHYAQDLGQPYHASALPGVGIVRMLGINGLAAIGIHSPKADAITLVSNRHMVIENYQVKRMTAAYLGGQWDDALLRALRDPREDTAHEQFRWQDARALVTRQAFDAADDLDRQLERSFPAHYTNDPAVSLGFEAATMDMFTLAQQYSPAQHQQLEVQLTPLLQHIGRYSRAIVREAVAPTSVNFTR